MNICTPYEQTVRIIMTVLNTEETLKSFGKSQITDLGLKF